MSIKLFKNNWIKAVGVISIFSVAAMSCQKEKVNDSDKLITEIGTTSGDSKTLTPLTTACSIAKIESFYDEGNSIMTRRTVSLATYDTDGRVTKEEIENNGGNKVTINYTYSNDKLNVTTYSLVGEQVESYQLDQLGRIVKYLSRQDPTEQMTDYVYNSEGYLSQKISYINKVMPNGTIENIDKLVTIYSYLSGNLVKIEATGYAMGVQYEGPTFVTKFEYDTSKLFSYLNGYNFWQREGMILPLVKYKNGTTLFGKMPVNRLTFRKEVNYGNNNQPYDLVRAYTYTEDDRFNVISMRETSDNKGVVEIKESKLTYFCE